MRADPSPAEVANRGRRAPSPRWKPAATPGASGVPERPRSATTIFLATSDDSASSGGVATAPLFESVPRHDGA